MTLVRVPCVAHPRTRPAPRPPAGKSSILAALLGELQPSRARGELGPERYAPSPVSVRGSVAYCSQVPWIVSGSLKVGRPQAFPAVWV